MQTILTLFLLSLTLNVSSDKESITPEIGKKFGEVIAIEARFIPKPNTYYDQNMVKEPFLISVVKVNGAKLKRPITMEYLAGQRNAVFKPGTTYRLKAYETVYDFGSPPGWDDSPAQINYRLIHRLVIKRAK